MSGRSTRGPAARDRLRREDGFSLIVVMLTFLTVSILAAVAYGAANGDTALRASDDHRKQAYAAAEAGVNNYLFQLRRDPSYWTHCTDVPPPGQGQTSPVSQPWDGNGRDTRSWRKLFESRASYTIELRPANGFGRCEVGDPQRSMLDQAQGTIQVRSTGRMAGESRSIVATFRRKAFLDFLYFTDFETLDPVAYQLQNPAQPPDCARYRYAGRPEPPCSAIVFSGVDRIDGPLHTNDDIRVCGSPTFGRSSADAIEVSGPAPGWSSGTCGGSPRFVGTWKPASPVMAMPPSNDSLKDVVAAQYTFTGTTTIRLNGGSMTVTSQGAGTRTMPVPPNGVVYVANGSCGRSYSVFQDYSEPPGCAVVYVQGSYSQSLTIASESDIVVTGDLTRNGNATLGLVANNFVRVYHPVVNRNGTSCSNAPSSPRDVDVEAAILTLQHSFIVDNYYCGAPLGTLTVRGVIAQRFRGPVGTGGASIVTGYAKRYQYDDRFAYLSPPHFLSPVAAGWDVVRHSEVAPAR